MHRDSRFDMITPKVVTKTERVYMNMLEKMREFPEVYTYFQNKSQHIIKPVKQVLPTVYYKKYMEPKLAPRRKFSRRCISLEPNLGRSRLLLPPIRTSDPGTPESITKSY